VGDRITVGKTTLVPREIPSQPMPPSASRQARQAAVGAGRVPSQERPEPASRPSGKAREGERTRPGLFAGFWLIQAMIATAIVCLGAGAFLPWLQVTGSLSKDLQPLLQGLADLMAVLSGPDSVFNVSQQIDGLEGYGKLTLLVAIVSVGALVVDVFFHRRSAIPGIMYLLSSLVAGGAIVFDLVNYYRLYGQMKDLTLLFGIQIEEVVEVFDQFLEVTVTPMIGLVLTGLGLILLLAGAIGRLSVAFFDRRR
jgi:hypothetical protein